MMALGGKPSEARDSGAAPAATSGSDAVPSSPTVHDASQAHDASHLHEATQACDTSGQSQGLWRRKKGKPSESRTQAKARRVEKGLPEELRGGGDLEGQERLQRASMLISVKNVVLAALSEFIGTFLFLFIAFGVANSASQQALISNTEAGTGAAGGLDAAALMVTSAGFGFSLAVNAWLWFRVSGGLFNPAVTLALFLTRSLSAVRAVVFMFVQCAAAIGAAGMAQVLIPGGINVRTRLGGSASVTQGFFIEFFMTSQLILAVFLLAGEKHKATFLAPIGIGLALFIAELFATSLTGGSLNPARTLGPDVIAASFDGSTWIYYAAPFSAAIICSALYLFLRWANFSTVSPGQDADGQQLLLRDAQGSPMGYVDRAGGDNSELERMRANAVQRSISREREGNAEAAAPAPTNERQAKHASAPPA